MPPKTRADLKGGARGRESHRGDRKAVFNDRRLHIKTTLTGGMRIGCKRDALEKIRELETHVPVLPALLRD